MKTVWVTPDCPHSGIYEHNALLGKPPQLVSSWTVGVFSFRSIFSAQEVVWRLRPALLPLHSALSPGLCPVPVLDSPDHLPLRLTLLISHESVRPVPNFFYFHLLNTPSQSLRDNFVFCHFILTFKHSLTPAHDRLDQRLWNDHPFKTKGNVRAWWLSVKETAGDVRLFCKPARTLSPVTWQVGLPRWNSGRESARQRRRQQFDPWVGQIPWRRNWQPTPVFLPGESHGQRSLVGCSSCGPQKSDIAQRLNACVRTHTHTHTQQVPKVQRWIGQGSCY